MARSITINQFKQLPDGTFAATGSVDDRPFTASTIKYRGEPIFKVLERDEEGGLGKLRLDKSGFGRKFTSFRRFKGSSKGKGWNSGFQRPGAWLKGAGKGKTGSGKGFGKSFGKGKSKGSPKGFSFGKGFGNSKGYGKSSGKGKTGKKGKYQQNDGFYSPYKRGW